MKLLLKRDDFPEEDDLVLCTVTNVHFHSVFVTLDEYEKSAMIHISEISPGRIRNIRDFVVEGKKIVCKVLRVNKEKGHIDLSLRRVTEIQKRAKLDKIKQEQKSEKIIEVVAKALKIDVKILYNEVFLAVSKKYDYLSDCFQEFVAGITQLDELGLRKELIGPLSETIKLRIKENKVIIGGELSLTTYEPNGIELIKEAIKKAQNNNDQVKISYNGGGKYKITVESKTYKEAEVIINKTVNDAIDYIKENNGEGEFARIG